jgi:hypothetical protein
MRDNGMDTRVITENLDSICNNACSSYADGYVASQYKKELVLLKHYISKLINECPNFGKLEDEWEQEILINILKYSE